MTERWRRLAKHTSFTRQRAQIRFQIVAASIDSELEASAGAETATNPIMHERMVNADQLRRSVVLTTEALPIRRAQPAEWQN